MVSVVGTRALSPGDRRRVAGGLRRIQAALCATPATADRDRGFLVSVFGELELDALLDEKNTMVLLEGEPEAPAGFALLTDIHHLTDLDALASHNWITGESRYLYQIAIAPGHERRGLGRELLDACKRVATHLVADIVISPVENTRSLRFFERNGFSAIGVLTLASYRDFGPVTSRVVAWPA
jgi:ribosomal protein S18 acetylase RimI-like enzyme